MDLPAEMKATADRQATAPNERVSNARVLEIDADTVATTMQIHEQQLDRSVRALSVQPGSYTVGPADILQITVWDHPELAAAQGALPQSAPRQADAPQGFVVDQEGNLQFPYVGSLHVAGLGTRAIQQRLTTALSQDFEHPQVTVRVASFRSKEILVDGEVHAPGAQQINDVPMTLTEAIGRAGGFTAAADQGRIALLRDDQSYTLNLPVLMQHGLSPSSIYLRRGDVLRVTSRDQDGAYVIGEVAKPTIAIPKQDGTLSLADALSQAGSFNLSTSNPKQLYVIRGAQSENPEIFHLDARSPVSMVMANRFPLRPDDVVYVDATDLVRINRILSLLLPAIDAGLTAGLVAK
ncbi:polysaccharide biosynthesis/export family protein [Paraburkholderia jirisanensis]